MSLEELNETAPLAPVFFNYDESEVLPDAQGVLAQNANWMRQWPSTRVRIEGHCDERGTNEYNLALGDSRSTSARDYLISLGIEPSRIASVSRGEEAPFCTGSEESCWSQNRRAQFVITAK
ncbi:MAG: peptidoglycan-associated lipoprotein Pal [Acidobacteria bacterium]|nr:peptidoglycan-associated lipoprotein Pal [Acidobacteriota bacterium]